MFKSASDIIGPFAPNVPLMFGKRLDTKRHSPIDYARGVYGTPRHKRLHGQRRQACR